MNNYYEEHNIYDKKLYKRKKYKTLKLLRFIVIFCSSIFFISWVVASSLEHIFNYNNNWFSKSFYFLNWNFWKKLLFTNSYFPFFRFSIFNGSIVFLFAFYISIYAFVIGYICAISLYALSSYYEEEEYKKLSFLYFFPIISFFLYVMFGFNKLMIHFYKIIPDLYKKHGQANWLIKFDKFVLWYIDTFAQYKKIFNKNKRLMTLNKNNSYEKWESSDDEEKLK